jgi:lactocepin
VPPGSTVDAEGNVTAPPTPPATENGWVKNEDGEWEYLTDGKAQTGWLYDTGYTAWFYLGTDGEMQTGWVYDQKDKAWYYLAGNGKMVVGKWLHDTDGNWYYLSGNGKMVTGKQNIGGKTYSFRGNGVWIG